MEEESIRTTENMTSIPPSDEVPPKSESTGSDLSTKKRASGRTKTALTVAAITLASCMEVDI